MSDQKGLSPYKFDSPFKLNWACLVGAVEHE